MFVINRKNCALPLYPAFADIIDQALQQAQTETSTDADDAAGSGYILNFRDPQYSAEAGGYHPVEIMISKTGQLAYITDFAYVGSPPYAELAKELDFDFTYGLFGQMGRDYPLQEGKALFDIFQRNFVSYYRSGIFTLSMNRF